MKFNKKLIFCSFSILFLITLVYYLRTIHCLMKIQQPQQNQHQIRRQSTSSNNSQKATIQCSDAAAAQPALSVKRVHQKSDFFVLSNYIEATQTFRCNESITYTTPGDFRFLDNLVVLVERWRGPISVALYAPGDDFQTTIDSISFLVSCTAPAISEYVSFHIFFEWYHMPKQLPKLNLDIDCMAQPPYLLNSTTTTYKSKHNLTYPINVARNIAKYESRTHFILASDIELIPTPDFIIKFLAMVATRPDLFVSSSAPEERRVFVLPLFEVPSDEQVPDNKMQLQEMYRSGKAFVFHKKLCEICHKIPKHNEWIATNEESIDKLDVFTMSKRQGRYKNWEPFYVGTKDEPDFDERLSWEGQSNKMTQGYLMCTLNYTFMILNNAFLVHRPGIKKSKTQLNKYGRLVHKTNKLLRYVIKPQLDILYGTTKGCSL